MIASLNEVFPTVLRRETYRQTRKAEERERERERALELRQTMRLFHGEEGDNPDEGLWPKH